MKSLEKKRFLILLALLGVLALTACSSADSEEPSPEPGVTTLVYAALNPNEVNRRAVEQFNKQHEDVQIEIRDYSNPEGDSSSGRDKWKLLLTEIASGQIPDIVDFGGASTESSQFPYWQMVEKGYLEDLWPYIENDPDLGREGVLEAPLKAAEINGGLYMVFSSVVINTLAGAESMVGDRTSWTMAEVRDAFAKMPEDSTILEYYHTKQSMFYYTFTMALDSYVDWETGQCSFDSDGFRSALEFVNSYPSEFKGTTNEELNSEVNRRWQEGRQMLTCTQIGDFQRIQILDAEFGGRAALIGYPVEDGSVGSSFRPLGAKLAISSTCRDKEAAWDFIRQMLLPRIGSKELETMFGEYLGEFPVNRADYEKMKLRAGNSRLYKDWKCVLFSGSLTGDDSVWLELHTVTDEEFSRLEDFFGSIEKIDICDSVIYDIVWEASGPYFAGDKTLDETVELIQNRVRLYVNENR